MAKYSKSGSSLQTNYFSLIIMGAIAVFLLILTINYTREQEFDNAWATTNTDLKVKYTFLCPNGMKRINTCMPLSNAGQQTTQCQFRCLSSDNQ